MSINHRDIERKALEVIEAYNITKPVVNVAEIAKGRGVGIKEIKMPDGYDGVAGFYDRDTKTIYLDVKDSPVRKLFTIAHELGHIFLEHPHYAVLFRIPKKDVKYSEQEQEANSFAAHLLMPEFMLRDYMQKYNLSKSDYKLMADIFGVPISSMRFQLEYLK